MLIKTIRTLKPLQGFNATRRLTRNVHYYCPRYHATLEPTGLSHDGSSQWIIGLTKFAMDEIILGDIELVSQSSVSSCPEPYCRISVRWSGLKQSNADELYHTIWESVTGEHIINLPSRFRVLPNIPASSVDHTAIYTIVLDERENGNTVSSHWQGLVTSEKEYAETIKAKTSLPG